MKRCLAVLLSALLWLTMLPMGVLPTVVAQEEPKPETAIVNVKDFGAVGDGKTDDEAAIWAAFECALMDYMIKDIPVTVYFPEGQYGLKNGGLYFYLPRGAGNLTIKGAGADKSTIVYLDEWTTGGSWVALRIYPKITPTSVDQYLHDITIEDLGVYDTDPVKHAWNKSEGDPGTEETHGFNIQHCVRATIQNCKVDSVGDEAIDMSHCIDSVMRDNLVLNSPGAGSAGGGISVGDGCKNVRVTNNTILGSIDNPNKTNWAIAIEALTERVEDIVVENNVIADIHGYGINVGAPAGTVANVSVQNNTISDCRDGGIRLSGSGQTDDVHLLNNTIRNTAVGIYLQGGNKDNTRIERGSIDATGQGIKVAAASCNNTLVQDVTITDSQDQAIYNAGTDTRIHRLFVDGSGNSDPLTNAAVRGGGCEISDSVILNCRNEKGIYGAAKVTNTYIDQPEIAGYTAITGVTEIRNCRVNRAITVNSGCVVDGLTVYATEDLGTHAIELSNLTDCTITNCRFILPSRYAVSEAGTANNNVITNNVCVGGNGIKTVGAATVATDNLRSTLATAEPFGYYIVDGTATVAAVTDSTLTEVEIPATLEGCPVTAIDPWAFAWCDSLAAVVLPNSVASIGHHAFYLCSLLANVYYTGSAEEWLAMAVDLYNASLFAANLTTDYQAWTPGDVDGNGKVNNRDLGRLQQHLNEWDVAIFFEAADLDGNGKVNNRDLGLLQRLLNE